MAEKTSDFRDLYVMASPGHDSLHVVRCDDAEGGFRDFINKNIDRALQTPMVPDNWLLHYRLPENTAREVPELAERSGRDYFRHLAAVFSRQGIAPQNIVRLRDAVFCREKQIPLLGFDAEHIMLAKRPDYLKTQQGYGAYLPELRGVLPEFKACNAVRMEQGVLLFSRSDKGDKLLGDLLQYHSLHFFDPELKEKSIGVYQLPLFDPSLKSLVDRYTPHVTRDDWQNTRMQGLPQEIFANHSALANGVLTKGYDFSPT